jgi:hypothetical protein
MAKQTFTTGQVLTAAQMTSLQQTAMGGGSTTAKTANYVLVAADAGTTVAMDAATATTITVDTGLFAAGDTVFIQNIGAGDCTITAGTATVDTAGSLILPQYDAGILYFTSASAAIFYDYIQVGAASPLTTKGDLYTYGTSDTRLGVGANGTTLVADSAEATGLKWATPAAGFVGARAFVSTSQTVNSGTTAFAAFTSESYDTDAFHDDVTNNTRFTIPSGKDGKYLITACVHLANPGSTTGNVNVQIIKNASTVLTRAEINGFSFIPNIVNLVDIQDLVATDYLRVQVFHDLGANVSISSAGTSGTYLAISYLGA